MNGSVNYNELTFLERVARAAREETYSAALAWMLDDSSSPLSLSKRASILQQLVGHELQISPERVLSIVAETEVNEIDILVRVDTSYKRVHVAIENKIKATDHSIQLATYDSKLAVLLRNEETHKIFLTLGGEAPRSGDGWKAVSYDNLHQAIVGHGLETESIYVRDFCAALKRLASVVKAAGDADTGVAAFAFGDTTIDPHGPSETERPQLFDYVLRTRLQKAVQRTWMNELAGHFRKVIPEHWAISIDETRGQGLIDVVTKLDLKPRIRVGLQLQGRALKMFVAPEAHDGETDESRATVAQVMTILQRPLGLEGRMPSQSRGKGFRSISVVGGKGEQQLPHQRDAELWAAACTPWIAKLVDTVGAAEETGWDGIPLLMERSD